MLMLLTRTLFQGKGYALPRCLHFFKHMAQQWLSDKQMFQAWISCVDASRQVLHMVTEAR